MVLTGELTALYSAISYAASATILSDIAKTTSPIILNFLRMLVSAAFTYLVVFNFCVSILPQDEFSVYLKLIISGISGIGLGDIFYFKTLGCIGARKTILLETMAPPFTGFISWVYYGKTLSIGGWIGIVITMSGVYLVFKNEENNQTEQIQTELIIQESNMSELPLISLSQQTTNDEELKVKSKSKLRGILSSLKDFLISPFYNMQKEALGLLNGVGYTFCWGLSMVLSHDAAHSGSLNPLQSALLRLFAGLVCVALIILIKSGERFHWPFLSYLDNKIFFLGILIGPILGIWSQQISLIYTKPEISQTIISTTPIFGIVFTYFKGEQLKMKYIYGALLAVLGVCIMIWY
ncbi:hypothetical protein ABPG72_004094 [Tetrahymena utriculariae]